MKSLFYTFMKRLISLGLRLYFNKIEIIGRKQLKHSDKTFIFCPNHQNAFLDALIIGVFAPVPIYSLTRASVFKKPYLWFLSALNMMPAYRKRDGYANLSKNEAIFEASRSLLQDGKSMLIFPEAVHHESYYLRPLTKGFARIALRSAKDSNKAIHIVPVGINYFKARFPRHKLLLHFGPSINVADYLAQYETDEVGAYNAIRSQLTSDMKSCVVIPDQLPHYKSQLNVFSRRNEELSFDSLRRYAQVTSNIKEVQYPKLKFLAAFLTLPNLPFHLFTNRVLRGLSEIEFYASIKFVFGLLLFPIWLIVIFSLVACCFSLKLALVVLAVQIISLFLRQHLLRFTH